MKLNLPTLAEVEAQRAGKSLWKSGLPRVLAKKDKQKSKDQQAIEFRRAVWIRDRGRSRATGRKVVKSGTLEWSKLGEVDHAIPRSLAPDRLYDVSNGLLLSKEENRLRKVVCAHAPEFKRFDYTGPDDRGTLQTFTWRDANGQVTRTRVG